MIGIGMIGEYISNIYDEVKNQPRYIIKKTIVYAVDYLIAVLICYLTALRVPVYIISCPNIPLKVC